MKFFLTIKTTVAITIFLLAPLNITASEWKIVGDKKKNKSKAIRSTVLNNKAAAANIVSDLLKTKNNKSIFSIIKDENIEFDWEHIANPHGDGILIAGGHKQDKIEDYCLKNNLKYSRQIFERGAVSYKIINPDDPSKFLIKTAFPVGWSSEDIASTIAESTIISEKNHLQQNRPDRLKKVLLLRHDKEEEDPLVLCAVLIGKKIGKQEKIKKILDAYPVSHKIKIDKILGLN